MQGLIFYYYYYLFLNKFRLTCESPTSDYDARSSSKTSRTKRTSAGGSARSSLQQSISLCQQVTSNNHLSGLDDRKLRNNIKSRQSKRLNNLPVTINEESSTTNNNNNNNNNNNSSPLTSPFRTNNNNNSQTFFSSENNSDEPQLTPCSEPNCHKRFTSNIALSYHLSNAHKKSEATTSLSTTATTTTTIPQASTRDEEDVAHILANVADYVRRSSPPASIRCSPEHQPSSVIINSPPTTIKPLENCSSTTLTWPCPQISSKLVLSSPLNNTEKMLSPNSNRFVNKKTRNMIFNHESIEIHVYLCFLGVN